jgi:hypothetical protein
MPLQEAQMDYPPPRGSSWMGQETYETIPNKGIVAGKSKGPEDSVRQPATLGRLALGRK